MACLSDLRFALALWWVSKPRPYCPWIELRLPRARVYFPRTVELPPYTGPVCDLRTAFEFAQAFGGLILPEESSS